MAKATQYELEIFIPGSADDVWVKFASPTPFMAIHVGDIINPGTWEGSQSPQKVLQVVGVEHLIWEVNGQVKHRLDVYTQEVAGTRELRLTGQATAGKPRS